MSKIDQAYNKAIEVLESCEREVGFHASGLKGGYEAIWARDSMITTLGASLVGDKFKKSIKKSLETLGKWQTENGQIPNCVGSFNIDRQSDKTYNSVDSSLWFIIGHFVYANAYKDHTLLNAHKDKITKALIWLRHQDPNEIGMIAQQPTMDWMDAFPHKYGHVINTQALYYAALSMIGSAKTENARTRLQKIVNGDIEQYLSLFDKELGHYLPWNWKNHDGDREQERWFDSLGNVLAIISGLANKKIATSILNFIEKEKINKPFPLKALWPPIKPSDKEWHSYFSKCDAREPLNYLNGGIWPFIGNFYVVALIKMKKFDQAKIELENMAEALMQSMQTRELKGTYEFNEWLHGADGDPRGEAYQAWSAGTFIYAYECLKQREVIYFE